MTHNIEAILEIRDVLYEQGAVEVDDNVLDAIVNVVVVQRGTDDLEIEYLEVKDNVVYLSEDVEEDELISLDFNSSEDTEVGKLMTRFQYEIEALALSIARDTPEFKWDYRLVE